MNNQSERQSLNREIKVNPSLGLMFKVNNEGIIEYVNHAFSEVSGYEAFEIIGESMDILHHPDMPKAIYSMLRERLESQKPMRLVNKILAKDGRYFWLITDFQTKINESGETVAHYAHSTTAPIYTVHKIESLYEILSNIELKSQNPETSKRYFIGFLEEREMGYDDFIKDLSVNRPEYEETYGLNSINGSTRAGGLNSLDEFRSQPVERKVVSSRAPKKKKKTLLKKVFGK
jgi:PAS domain S-box-containing protein